MKTYQRGFIGIALLIILGLLVVAGGAYYYHAKHSTNMPDTSNVSINSDSGESIKLNDYSSLNTNNATSNYVNTTGNINSTTTKAVSPTTGWKIYTNPQFGYKISYPGNWIAQPNIVTGTAGVDFCPPELSNGTVCKDDPNSTKPPMAEPGTLAPIQILTYGRENIPIMEGISQLGKDKSNTYTFIFRLVDRKYLAVHDQMEASFFRLNEPPVQIPDTSSWSTYTDVNNKFTFKYPNDFSIRVGDHPNYPQGSFLKTHVGENSSVPVAVTAILSSDSNPSFSSAWLTIASDPVIANEIDCRNFQKNGNIQLLSQPLTISGVSWYGGTTAGVAAGTITENYINHILHNGACYEVDINLAITSSNYVPNDETKILEKMYNVFSTFKFIN